MSETEIKKEEVVSEANSVVNKDAVAAEPSPLKMTLKIWVKRLLNLVTPMAKPQRKR